MKLLLSMVVISVAWLGLAVDDGPDLTGVKCIVRGNVAAKADKSSDYHNGHVYFCCGNCKAKFDADPGKFTVKANHQLALTGQYVQVASPFGGKCAEGMSTKVGGVEVCFGNEKDLKKVNAATDLAAKAKMVFGKKAFAKAFKPKQNVDLTGGQMHDDVGKKMLRRNRPSIIKTVKFSFVARNALASLQAIHPNSPRWPTSNWLQPANISKRAVLFPVATSMPKRLSL